ncbi:MAG: hypothetical protein NC213_07650 [Acetobacter sp.]|nr:hypothetical protein [Bacteroides sp.]MCM1341604.1 hypothetical protein [Acetobacter sp.]MCM1434075.1 hypothetical protein [Clostridiales bacterium]
MNEKRKTVFHYFKTQTTYELNSFKSKKSIHKKKAGKTEDGIIAILATPIMDGEKIIGALTFDFDENLDDYIKEIINQDKVHQLLEIARTCAQIIYEILYCDIEID